MVDNANRQVHNQSASLVSRDWLKWIGISSERPPNAGWMRSRQEQNALSMDKEMEGSSRDRPHSSSVWRTVWAVVFVFLSVEAMLLAAFLSSRRQITVTKPILRIDSTEINLEFDQSKVEEFLSENWSFESTTLHFRAGSEASRNPKAYLDAVRADYEFLVKRIRVKDVPLPSDIYFFGAELDSYIERAGRSAGWVDDSKLFLPSRCNAAKPLLEYILDSNFIDYDPRLVGAFAGFIGGFLDFYTDHPYENEHERNFSLWQRETTVALPIARQVLDDERLGPDFVSIPVRHELLFDDTPRMNALRAGFLHYLLDQYGWEGYSKLFMSGDKTGESYKIAYGKNLPDLLKVYQEALDLLPKDAFLSTVARIEAFDAGALSYAVESQVVADAESVLKEEVKRFRLPANDQALRNAALGELYYRKYMSERDPESPPAKKLAADAEGLLLSPKSNFSKLDELAHKWLVAGMYEKRGEHEAADKLYDAALSNPDLRDYYSRKLIPILITRRNFQRAADVLASYCETHPTDLDMLYLKMACQKRIGNAESAAETASLVLKHPLIELGFHKDYRVVAEYISGGQQAAEDKGDSENSKDDAGVQSDKPSKPGG